LPLTCSDACRSGTPGEGLEGRTDAERTLAVPGREAKSRSHYRGRGGRVHGGPSASSSGPGGSHPGGGVSASPGLSLGVTAGSSWSGSSHTRAAAWASVRSRAAQGSSSSFRRAPRASASVSPVVSPTASIGRCSYANCRVAAGNAEAECAQPPTWGGGMLCALS
jgi:hypothetical protein